MDGSTLPLDALQRILLAQLDGTDDVATLAQAMGLPPERLEALLAGLVAMGAVSAEPPASESPDPREAEPEPVATEDLEAAEDPAAEAAAEALIAQAATHRQLFEQTLHKLTVDERAAGALLAVEPELSAYCFDPMPKVIQAILENPRAGLAQARLIATHHRNPAGLEAMASRAPSANDAGVRRGLLQNPQLPGTVFRRLWSSRRLSEQYLVATSRDAPEQTRRLARGVLLAGLTIDGKTTALLCRHTYVSTLLIQNIARWSAAPPQLIAHLRKQDSVHRNAQLRLRLERHPNAS